MKKHLFFYAIFLVATILVYPQKTANDMTLDYTQYVNTMIDTSKMCHTFPGATAPFGMVQLSPQTNFQELFKADGSYNPETYE